MRWSSGARSAIWTVSTSSRMPLVPTSCCWADRTRADVRAAERRVPGAAEGVPLLAMQRNRWWPTSDGPALDAGMFVAGLEYAARVSATVIGKPSQAIYRSACALLGVEPGRAMMVGDDLETDLPPARSIGMRTCLVRTGKGSTFAGPVEADLDLPNLAALPGALTG